MISTNSYKPTILAVLTILAFSTFVPALAYAAPMANTAADWQYVNGNSWAQNYSPQTQITPDNVDQLEVKWIFAAGGMRLAPEGLGVAIAEDGVTTPPIVRNGVVYITTNFLRTYAIDAKNGKQLWEYQYLVDWEEESAKPWIGPRPYIRHMHGFRYWEGGDAILLVGAHGCELLGVDAKTGDENFRIEDLCRDVPGNLYAYRGSPSTQASVGTYDKGRQFIMILPGMMHSTIWAGDARHVTIGIDMDTRQILWRVFSFPPHGVPSKDWALQQCDIGFFQTYPCTEVAARNRAGLEWDWAFPGEPPSIYGGVTANWGQLVVDEDTGIMYTNTGNQGPYTNVSLTPGPRLYGSTLMAIDMNKGQMVWWLQPFPHDPYDYDCNWSGILAEDPTLGKVYMKGCKEGRLYVVDAATGEPHYVVDLVQEMVDRGQITSAGAIEHGQPGGVKYHLTDPFSYGDLREWGWITDGRYCTAPCDMFPFWSNGVFGTDPSYDPETSTLISYAVALQTTIIAEHPYVVGQRVTTSKTYRFANSSIVARDVTTGDVKWTWFYPLSQQRSHIVVAGDVVFTGFSDGFMRFFDKDTGRLLREINMGAAMITGPTTGQDADGNQLIFTIVGSGRDRSAQYGPGGAGLSRVTGIVAALGLTERARTVTTTATMTTTSRTTVTTTTATTVTTTLAPQTVTTTTTAPAQTVTTTQEVTETVGLPSEVTYAAVAVAVIAIIAAAVLATRRRT